MTYQISKEESRRYDALKVLMCLFVLMIHAFSNDFMSSSNGALAIPYWGSFVLSRVICDCAVPIFVLISSVLLYAKPIQFGKNAKKKCQSLLIPYLIFNTLWVLLMFVKHLLGKRLGIQAGDDIDFAAFSPFQWVDAYLGLVGDYKPLLTTLWYVRDLFLLNLLAVPIKKLVDWMPIPVLIASVGLWLAGVNVPGIQPYSLYFFIWGYYLVKYQIHFENWDKRVRLNWLAVAYGLLVAAVSVSQRAFEPLNRLYLLVAVVFWIRCSTGLLHLEKPAAVVLPATFFIYLTHRFVYAIIQIVVNDSLVLYLITYVLKPVLALAVLLGIFYLLKRLMPGVLAVMVGGRVAKKEAKA